LSNYFDLLFSDGFGVTHRPAANLLITGGGRFHQMLDLSVFENWSSQWLSRGNLDFKIIVIDHVTLWSKLECRLRGKSNGFY